MNHLIPQQHDKLIHESRNPSQPQQIHQKEFITMIVLYSYSILLTITMIPTTTATTATEGTNPKPHLSTFRHTRDAIHGLRCSDIKARHGTGSVCFCKAKRSTLMSEHGGRIACRKPSDVGCRYIVVSRDQVFGKSRGLARLVEKDFIGELKPR